MDKKRVYALILDEAVCTCEQELILEYQDALMMLHNFDCKRDPLRLGLSCYFEKNSVVVIRPKGGIYLEM